MYKILIEFKNGKHTELEFDGPEGVAIGIQMFNNLWSDFQRVHVRWRWFRARTFAVAGKNGTTVIDLASVQRITSSGKEEADADSHSV